VNAATAINPGVRAALDWIASLPPHPTGQRHLRLDSRTVRPGDVFVAVAGGTSDGRQHLGDAMARGAAGALVDADGWKGAAGSVPLRAVPHLHRQLGSLAAEYYGRPSEGLTSVGVTGTNGKTSCSQWIAQVLTREGRRCAVIGTVGSGFPGALEASDLTTPDPVSLQREVRRLLDAGAQALAMEVSSIGLAQGRVEGMHFDVALFTNLTRDHLDFHQTMRQYEAAKSVLFGWPGLRFAVINLDDEAGCRFATLARDQGVEVIGYSARGDAAPRPMAPRVLAHDVRATAEGLSFELQADGTTWPIEVPLVGHFNVANLLGVIGASYGCGISFEAAMAALPQLAPPPGRMQRVDAQSEPLVIVDYAHTPDALTQALEALRPMVHARHGRLWVVFGAGGDRDPGKRAPMGAAAAAGADVVVVTSDNPRTENPAHIVAQVAAGAQVARQLDTEVDRALAINQAVQRAAPNDVVLIAGKGHEDYQIVGGARLPFSDLEHARRALAGRARATR
jgi:UDP-N-acetylmuramoyl-L-alanyl-D-glutamate--2,6-diaminopimelate ligase